MPNPRPLPVILAASLLAAPLAVAREARADAIPLETKLPPLAPPGETSRHVLYLNPDGASFTHAPVDDARLELSSLVPASGASVPPIEGDGWGWGASFDRGDWAEILRCARVVFAPYRVEVTDVDPGTVPHLEVVVGGRPEDAGLPADRLGAARHDPSGGVVENGVAFVFSEAIGRDLDAICRTVAHEAGHLLGAGDVALEEDAMGPELSPGQTFSRADRGSAPRLLEVLGATESPDLAPPEVRLVSPVERLTSFSEIRVVTSDDVRKVEFYFDGRKVQTAGARPFEVDEPFSFGEGTHEIRAVATDGSGHVASDAITVRAESAGELHPGGPEIGCSASPRAARGGAGLGLVGLVGLAGLAGLAGARRRARRV